MKGFNLIQKSKFPFYYILGLGFIYLLDGLTMIVTLGFYTTNFTLPYVFWFAKQGIKKEIKKL